MPDKSILDFPDAPSHPDLAAMDIAVKTLDATLLVAHDAGEPDPATTAIKNLDIADTDCLDMFGAYRGILIADTMGLPKYLDTVLDATWVEGFAAGVLFERAKRDAADAAADDAERF